MTSAFHVDCTLEEYHRRPEYGRSQLQDGLKSWSLFHGRHVLNPPEFPVERKEVYDLGTSAHAAVLGGVWNTYRILPRNVLSKSGARSGAAYDGWRAAHPGKIDLKRQEAASVRRMVRNVYAHADAGRILRESIHREFTIIWQDEETGLWLRARPDIVSPYFDGVLLADLKTDRATTLREIAKHSAEHGYHRQAAHYWDACAAFGMKVYRFVLIFVDKSPAHECRSIVLPDRAIQRGREELRIAKVELKRRLETGNWNSAEADETFEVDLPEWAYKDDPWSTN